MKKLMKPLIVLSFIPFLMAAGIPDTIQKWTLPAPDYTDNQVIIGGTAETVTVPTDMDYVFFSCDSDFYVSYITAADVATPTNGTMASDTSWTKGTGWSIAAGVADSDASQVADSDLTQTFSGLVAGRSYSVSMTVANRTAGNITPILGGTEGTDRAGNATYTETIVAGSSDSLVGVRADLNWDGDVDDITITPVAIVPTADITGGGGVELNPTVRYVRNLSKMSVICAANCVMTLDYYTR